MKVIVDLINKSFKVLENEKNIYVGNNNADVLKLYCYNGGYHLENEFVSITGLLSNGRKIGPFTTDSAYDEEYIDGKLHIVANFTLTKQNGFTLSEGQLNITIWHNKTNDSGAIISKQAIGNLLFNVVKTANVDENIIITDSSGDVIYNFKLEIENIQSAVNSVNSSFVKFKQHTEDSLMRLEDNKADLEVMWDAFDNYSEQIPYGDRKFAWLLNFTGDSLLIDMINELSSRDLFVDDKGKFWVEIGLEKPTVIEDIRITKQKKVNGNLTGYGINSIIRSGSTIRVFMKSVAKNSTMTINEFINEHKQVATKEEIPTKVSQLENDNKLATEEFVNNKVANLVNSAPETLDTLGELAAALEDNKDVVEALDEAITKKADISYVDEKVANAGVPTDLLDRVETLETKIPTKTSQLTNDSAFINQTQLDEALANVGSGGGSVSLYKHTIAIEHYGFNSGELYFNLTFYNLNSKSIIEDAQDGNEASDKLFNYLLNKDSFSVDCVYSDSDIITSITAFINGGVNSLILQSQEGNEFVLPIEEFIINDYEPVLMGTASGGTGGGASGGKEVIIADNDFYTSIYGSNSDLGSLFLDFSKFNLNNKNIVLDLSWYDQDFDNAITIMCDFMNSTIKNATIIIKNSSYYGLTISEKTTIYAFKDGGALFLDHATESIKGNVFDFDSYCNLDYGDMYDFSFGIISNLGDYRVKIDFDENGYATCQMVFITEL